ncbi:hypothetical protein CYANOKiyG1_42960 [Okeania sp. KiyG1]|nr:hypothetical protein CYANOKiyG1_42960 [Okeania sp. KiyG1]
MGKITFGVAVALRRRREEGRNKKEEIRKKREEGISKNLVIIQKEEEIRNKE